MVRAKMECMEYILLCLEDTNDWSNATTRRLVMQVQPCAVAMCMAGQISSWKNFLVICNHAILKAQCLARQLAG